MSLLSFEWNQSSKTIIQHWNLVFIRFLWLSFLCFPPVHLSITTAGHLELFQDPPPAFMMIYHYDDLVIILNIRLFTPDLPVFIQRKVSEKIGSDLPFLDITPRTVCLKQHLRLHLLCSHGDKSYLACHLSAPSTSFFFLITKLCHNPNRANISSRRLFAFIYIPKTHPNFHYAEQWLLQHLFSYPCHALP